ncbi:MAG: S-methyl-5-thioribose-1-phosphate isomerase, partial [Victivallaceae bacterium]
MQTVRWLRQDRQVVDRRSPETLNQPGKLRLLDQTLLPERELYLEMDSLAEVIDAIRRLAVRGAPAIGCGAALGLAAAAQHYRVLSVEEFFRRLEADGAELAAARPTAVNLRWAVERVISETRAAAPALNTAPRTLLGFALDILSEDIGLCRAIGEHGRQLLFDGATVLTHCNAGALATGDYGTALAPVYCAHEEGLKVKVYSDETRPLLQGSRLTAW